jgi:hypothetical protein
MSYFVTMLLGLTPGDRAYGFEFALLARFEDRSFENLCGMMATPAAATTVAAAASSRMPANAVTAPAAHQLT